MNLIEQKQIIKKALTFLGLKETVKTFKADDPRYQIVLDILTEKQSYGLALHLVDSAFEKDEKSAKIVDFLEAKIFTGESSKTKKESPKKVEIPEVARYYKPRDQQSNYREKQDQSKISLNDLGYSPKKVFLVSKKAELANARKHFFRKSIVGLSLNCKGAKVHTVSLASDETIAVIDIDSFRDMRNVVEFFNDILTHKSLDIVAFDFGFSAFILERFMGINPQRIRNVLDLKEIWKGSIQSANDNSTITINSMAKQMLGKKQDFSLLKRAQRNNDDDIIDQEIVNFSAIGAAIRLKIFFAIEDAHKTLKMKYYDYIKPIGIERILGIEKISKEEFQNNQAMKKNTGQNAESFKEAYGFRHDKEFKGSRTGRRVGGTRGGYGGKPGNKFYSSTNKAHDNSDGNFVNGERRKGYKSKYIN